MKILIVEDSAACRNLLQKMLEKMRYQVVSAQDGLSAWKIFEKNDIRMVITDWTMPVMDGLALLKKIRNSVRDNYTYVILVTARNQKQDIVEALESGADDYITKPLDPGELRARVRVGERIVCLENKYKVKNDELESTLKRLKDTQVQMIQSEKLASIGQLAAGVAHEINNPIGFISSNLNTLEGYENDIRTLLTQYRQLASSLKQEGIGGKQQTEILKRLENIEALEREMDVDFVLNDIPSLIMESQEGANRIRKIIIDMKDFAHPGDRELKYADINQNLESTLNIVWNELKYKATVTKEYGKLPPVLCYPQELNQVFMNILVNAAQAIKERGEIKVSTKALDDKVEIKIADTGSGIPEENLSRIFEPFFTTKDVGKGTGLGLNVAYNIIKKHNGTIDVESTIGKGTTFIVTIPFG